MKKNQCEICGRPREGNADDYYHERACKRRDIMRRMTFTIDPVELGRLRRERDRVSYVGD